MNLVALQHAMLLSPAHAEAPLDTYRQFIAQVEPSSRMPCSPLKRHGNDAAHHQCGPARGRTPLRRDRPRRDFRRGQDQPELKTLPEDSILFVIWRRRIWRCWMGMATRCERSWPEFRNLIVFLAGPNPAASPG